MVDHLRGDAQDGLRHRLEPQRCRHLCKRSLHPPVAHPMHAPALQSTLLSSLLHTCVLQVAVNIDEGTWLAVGFSHSGSMVAFSQANFTPALVACAAVDFVVNVSATCEDGASRGVSISYAQPSDALRQCFGALPATHRVPCEHAPRLITRRHRSAPDHAPGCSGQPRPISRLGGTGHVHRACLRHRHVPWTSPVAGFFFVAAPLAICFKLVVASALYAKRKEDAVRFAPTPPPTPATHPTTPLPLPLTYTLYPHRYASRSRCSRACSSVARWPST